MILAQARQLLHQSVSPDGPDSSLVVSRLNELCERFFISGKWKGTLAEVDLEVIDNHFTLPWKLEAVLGITLRGVPRIPFGRWYNFNPSGPGQLTPDAYSGPDVVVDTGDHHPFFRNPPYETFTLKVSVDNLDDTQSNSFLLVKGYDSAGKRLFAPDGSEGHLIQLDSAVVSTLTSFSRIESVVKPITQGGVEVTAVDATGAETLVAQYQPSETDPRYRKYRVETASTDTTVVRALCKRKFVPLVGEHDEVIPGNMGALKLGLLSLKYEDTNDLERAMEYFMRAISLLNSELKEHRGAQLNTLRLSPHGFGLGRVQHQY